MGLYKIYFEILSHIFLVLFWEYLQSHVNWISTKIYFVMNDIKNNVFCTYVYDDIVGSNYRTAYYLWSFETFFWCE